LLGLTPNVRDPGRSEILCDNVLLVLPLLLLSSMFDDPRLLALIYLVVTLSKSVVSTFEELNLL